jgi:hypothetical protein
MLLFGLSPRRQLPALPDFSLAAPAENRLLPRKKRSIALRIRHPVFQSPALAIFASTAPAGRLRHRLPVAKSKRPIIVSLLPGFSRVSDQAAARNST